MFPINPATFLKIKNLCQGCRAVVLQRCAFSQELEDNYNQRQKEKILQVMNDSCLNDLSGYDITKGRLKKFSQWKSSNGELKNLSDVELIDGFSEKIAKKFFDSILEGPQDKTEAPSKIKGQYLHPHLSERTRQSAKSVLTVHVEVNSISWTLIDRRSYEVVEWVYHGIDYPESKRLQITDILDIAWGITHQLPTADIYVMKAEATTLRAAGSDPNNPKVIAVNLQKAQLVAMIVAMINFRSNTDSINQHKDDSKDTFNQKTFFLRPSLPYRLYGTLVGNERVSTDQTIEMLLQNYNEKSATNTHVHIPERLKTMFRSQNELQRDMLGQCLLLALTFMDVVIYKNLKSITKLAKREK